MYHAGFPLAANSIC